MTLLCQSCLLGVTSRHGPKAVKAYVDLHSDEALVDTLVCVRDLNLPCYIIFKKLRKWKRPKIKEQENPRKEKDMKRAKI